MDGERGVKLLKERMDSPENSIGGFVFTSEIPPAFDHSFVVAVDFKMSASMTKPGDRSDEKLEADSFSPANVPLTVERVPSWDETPCSPSIPDGDGNADARTCI